MSRQPAYMHRFRRVTQALHILTHHPEGLPVAALADQLGVDEKTLRAEILAYYRADIDPASHTGLLRDIRIEFVGADPGADADPDEAAVVRVFSEQPAEEIGVAHLTVTELARVFRAGRDLLALEPGNTVLAEALSVLETTLLQGIEAPGGTWLADRASLFRQAIRERRRVRVRYSRTWQPGVRERVIEPHRLVRSRRGWELDADVVGGDAIRIFLLSGVQEAEVLDETFERSADVDARIAANRTETPVDIVVPQSARWAVERFAESVDVLQEDEESVKLRAHLLPPVRQRLGLMMLVAGPEAFVVTPAELVGSGRDLAHELLVHHSSPPSYNV